MSSASSTSSGKRDKTMKAGIGATLLIAAIAAYFGAEQQYLAARCLTDIQQQQDAREQHDASGEPARSPGPAEKPDLTKAVQSDHDRHVAGDPRGASCFWPNKRADLVIARASLNFSYIGFLAAVLFGTVGVLGIYLSYSLAGDAVGADRDRRS